MEDTNHIRIKMMKDFISLLPDCLLVDIISRLNNTEETITTSILSKRWKYLWTQVPTLKFSYYKLEFPKFISYIENIVRQRGQSKLNKLSLSMVYRITGCESTVSKLIRYAVTCDVQDLDLSLHDFEPMYVLDQFFFINSSFTHLKLWSCLFDNATGVISWSNLKLLSIRSTQLNDNLVKNILSGSPLLETLYLIQCHGFGRIEITSPSLKKLVVDGYGHRKYIADILEIYAPHILSLKIEEELFVSKVVLLNVSSLVEARLDYWISSSSREVKEEMLKDQIESLCRVEKLEFGFYIVKLLARLEAKGYNFPSNMEYHELTSGYDGEGYKSDNSTDDSDWSDNDNDDNDYNDLPTDCDWSDNDLSTDSDWSYNDSIESEDE